MMQSGFFWHRKCMDKISLKKKFKEKSICKNVENCTKRIILSDFFKNIIFVASNLLSKTLPKLVKISSKTMLMG